MAVCVFLYLNVPNVDVILRGILKDVILQAARQFGVWEKLVFEMYRIVFEYVRDMVYGETAE
jgi:hypothetical protein